MSFKKYLEEWVTSDKRGSNTRELFVGETPSNGAGVIIPNGELYTMVYDDRSYAYHQEIYSKLMDLGKIKNFSTENRNPYDGNIKNFLCVERVSGKQWRVGTSYSNTMKQKISADPNAFEESKIVNKYFEKATEKNPGFTFVKTYKTF